jgi:sugar fermentation stimulation protein A
LGDGALVTAHVPNTGRMTGCWEDGAPVQLSYSEDPRRRLAWTLERVDMGHGWIGVHTGRPNAVLAEGIAAGLIPTLAGYRQVRREVAYAPPGQEAGRLDIGLGDGLAPTALVEIKNATLLDGGRVLFPDAVSLRGLKHLDLLETALSEGYRAVILFAINRPEGSCFAPARSIDPLYAKRLRQVVECGVEPLAVRLRHTPEGIEVGETLPVLLD